MNLKAKKSGTGRTARESHRFVMFEPRSADSKDKVLDVKTSRLEAPVIPKNSKSLRRVLSLSRHGALCLRPVI